MFGMSIKTLFSLGGSALVFVMMLSMYITIKHVQLQRDTARLQVKELSLQIDTQNRAIDQWKQESLAYENRLKGAEKKAAVIVKDYQKKLLTIEDEKIDANCEASIAWAIDQASKV